MKKTISYIIYMNLEKYNFASALFEETEAGLKMKHYYQLYK